MIAALPAALPGAAQAKLTNDVVYRQEETLYLCNLVCLIASSSGTRQELADVSM
jgi:hypothetical protein